MTIIVLLILAGVSLNAIVGENGIITNAQNAKVQAEEAELWEQIQMILVESEGIEFDSFDEKVEWVQDQFELKGLNATAGTWLEEGKMILTYGIDGGTKHGVVIQNNLEKNMEGNVEEEFELITASGYVPGDTNNQGEWEIEVITTENKTTGYSGTVGTARIKGYHGNYGNIEIPNIVYIIENGKSKGYLVTELLSGLFMNCNDEEIGENVTSIKLNEGLQVIGARCFYGDDSIVNEVIFPKSLIYIGDSAFAKCTEMAGNLNTIVKQQIIMGKNVFSKCKKMSGEISLIMPQKEGGDYTDDVKQEYWTPDSNVEGGGYYKIPNGYLSGCSGLTGDLVIPNFIQKIGENAFYGCEGIESISYEEESKLEEIEAHAFERCTGITSKISFPKTDNGIVIGESSFAYVEGGDIDLTGVKEIGGYCFRNYKGNSNLEEPKSFTSSAVYKSLEPPETEKPIVNEETVTNVVDVNLGDMITEIPQYCFYNAKIIFSRKKDGRYKSFRIK